MRRRLLLALLIAACADDAPEADDCGGGCPSGQVCTGGACVAAPCDETADCPAGQVCADGGCARPAAECDDDADCDGGRCVEGACFASQCAEGETRPCETACGPTEQRCRGGVWRACPAPTEQCGDGLDDDCDGAADEGCTGCDEGATRPCETMCGAGVEQCASDAWQACDAPPPGVELCDDGADGDCDGAVDEGCAACREGQVRPCAAECGDGEQTCAAEAWGACSTAPVDGACPMRPPACDLAARKPTGDVRLSAPGGRAWFPRVVWTGDEYAVFWSDRRGDVGLTTMRRVTAAGDAAGSPRDLVERNFHDADWTGDGYLVLTVSVGRLAVSDVSAFGAVRGTVEHPDLTRSGLDAAVAWNGRALGAVWSENLEDLYFARFDAGGDLVGSPRRLTNAPGRSFEPSLIADGDGWALAFVDERDAPGELQLARIWFVRLNAQGVERAPAAPVADGTDPSLVKTRDGYGLAFHDARGGPDAVWFVALDGEGRRRGDDVPVSDSPGNARAPALAWTGDGFGVAWGDGRDDELWFARLGADGARVGPAVRLTDAPEDSAYPSLVWTGDRFGLAWSDDRDAADPADQADVYFAGGPLTCPE